MKKSEISARFLGCLLAFAVAIPIIPASIISDPFCMTASAAVNFKFDFGGAGTASGFTGVKASEAYDKSKGYGFADTSHVSDVTASGENANSDAVRFTSTDPGNTFNVDLPKGLYQITVTTGDTTRTSIRAENMLQLINLTGDNAVETFQIPVTDGQLNLMATEGRAGTAFSISSVEITQINTTAQTNPTIWLCGDSTVANYYNTPDTAQHGWGQFLKNYLPAGFSGYEVRNMAASGQYAKGFMDAGQFDAIETYGKAGDYYIISIGINDTNYSDADEYYQTVTDMVRRAKAKGMTVILVKQQGRRSDLNREKLLSGRWFGGQMDQIGTEQDVKVIDLFTPWQDFGLSLGFEAMEEYYAADDDLHQSKTGSMKLASLMAELAFAESGTQIPENQVFMLRNGNSGQYLAVDGKKDGANVYQSADPDLSGQAVLWKAVSAGDGYYRLYHAGSDKLLDLANGDSKNGTNIGIWGDTASDAQLFKFIAQENGSYVIVTKSSEDQSAVEVMNASVDHQGNIQQWERNGHACQTWFIDPVQTAVSENNNIPGDVNQDGIVNIYDTLILKQKIKKNSVSHDLRKRADLNGDAVIDSQDVNSLLNYLHKGISDFQNTGRNVYYAADAGFSRGITENTNSGFVSENYLNLDNTAGSFVEFQVNAPKTGNYLCTFRIANGSSSNRQMKIEVNHDIKNYWMQDFLSTNAWTEWQERAIVLPLQAGMNQIRLTSMTADGAPNIDYLRTELTDEPVAEIYIPEQKPDLEPAGKTTIYIAGDSTVQSYRASYAPQQGWGYYLTDYFSDNVNISNQAIAGRSSKSFYDNGRLQTILDSMQKDDYLLIQFAINDSAKGNEERYAPVCGNVENPENGSYEFYIEKYIEGTLEKGGTPILVTTVIGLKTWSGSQFNSSYTEYCNACKDMAKKYQIPCIDLNTLMVSHYNQIGYDAAYQYHLCGAVEGSTDMTHFTETGANAVAGLVAGAIRDLDIPVSREVK